MEISHTFFNSYGQWINYLISKGIPAKKRDRVIALTFFLSNKK